MNSTNTTISTPNPTARFWDRIANKYARSPISDEDTYRKKLQITQDYLRPDMEVLEFGCGTGSTALVHAPYVKHIQAIDISAKMIEIAKAKTRKDPIANVTFRVAEIDTFEAPDVCCDAVLGLSILHLLENRDEAISKVFAMLKPGGVFISSTACLGDNLKIFKLIAPLGRWLRLLPILKVFTTDELVKSFEACGFEIERKWSPGKNKSVFIVARKPA
jgi:ubiquinone/menaquinone biosynthesis C-methylase UbiE